MKLIRSLLHLNQTQKQPTQAEAQRELLIENGRQQFKKLIDQGIGIQVGLA